LKLFIKNCGQIAGDKNMVTIDSLRSRQRLIRWYHRRLFTTYRLPAMMCICFLFLFLFTTFIAFIAFIFFTCVLWTFSVWNKIWLIDTRYGRRQTDDNRAKDDYSIAVVRQKCDKNGGDEILLTRSNPICE